MNHWIIPCGSNKPKKHILSNNKIINTLPFLSHLRIEDLRSQLSRLKENKLQLRQNTLVGLIKLGSMFLKIQGNDLSLNFDDKLLRYVKFRFKFRFLFQISQFLVNKSNVLTYHFYSTSFLSLLPSISVLICVFIFMYSTIILDAISMNTIEKKRVSLMTNPKNDPHMNPQKPSAKVLKNPYSALYILRRALTFPPMKPPTCPQTTTRTIAPILSYSINNQINLLWQIIQRINDLFEIDEKEQVYNHQFSIPNSNISVNINKIIRKCREEYLQEDAFGVLRCEGRVINLLVSRQQEQHISLEPITKKAT